MKEMLLVVLVFAMFACGWTRRLKCAAIPAAPCWRRCCACLENKTGLRNGYTARCAVFLFVVR